MHATKAKPTRRAEKVTAIISLLICVAALGVYLKAVRSQQHAAHLFRELQSPRTTDRAAKLAAAQKFLHALYPEIKPKDYAICIISAGGADTKWPFQSDIDIAPSVLAANFQFQKNSELIDAVYVEFSPWQARSASILADVNSHREWSDKQVIAQLKNAGAMFGPDDRDALLKQVPVGPLEPFIGRLQIESSEFHLRHKQPRRSLAQPHWEVDVESTLPDGHRDRWSLVLDSFSGRLQSISRRPGSH